MSKSWIDRSIHVMLSLRPEILREIADAIDEREKNCSPGDDRTVRTIYLDNGDEVSFLMKERA